MSTVAADYDDHLTDTERWTVTGVVMLGMIMSIIDASIVNVALPHMMGTFGANIQQIAWVVTGYTLSNVIIIPLSAWLASLVGRARLYNWSVVSFTAASALCGLAPSFGLLVAARVIQGFGAGLMMPLGQAILYEAFPPERRGASMAVFGMGIMVGPAIGPTLGGWITDNMGWRWIFYINLPIGIVATVLVAMILRDPPYLHRRTNARADLMGVVLLALGVGILQYVLDEGSDAGWFDADWVIIASTTSVVLLAAFVAWEMTHEDPAVDLSVFADTTFRSTVLINVVVGVGLMGGMFVLPVYMQNVLGLSATQTGIVLLPGAVATALSMAISGRLSDRGYAKSQVAIGLVIFGASMWMMGHLTADAGMPQLFWPQVLRGLGMGFTFVPLSVVAVYTIPKPQMGQASGMINLTRRLGGSLGIAWLAAQLDDARVARVHWLVSHVDPYRAVAREQVQMTSAALAGRGIGNPDHAALLVTYGRVAKAAADMAFQHTFILIVFLFIGSMPLLLLLRKQERDGSTAKPGGRAAHMAE